MAIDLGFSSATLLAEKIRRKEISPVDVVDSTLARIDSLNPKLNCFCFVFDDEARANARKAEERIIRGQPIGPLHGIPVAFKDMTPTKGNRTTLGSKLFEHSISNRDAVIVERLVGAGAIVVGKTTTSELAATGFTETKLWGITRNPWDLSRGPGGSSGGSGSAVSAGCVPIAEGCDMGGSVRIPAAFCGIVGLKPSFGRIPFDILPSQVDSYCHFGPLTRGIDDAALFLSIAQGRSDRDLSSLPNPSAIPHHVTPLVAGLRLALSVDLGYYAVDQDVEHNLIASAAMLEEQGAIVEAVQLPLNRELNDIGIKHWSAYMAILAGGCLKESREDIDPFLVGMIEDGLRMDAVTFKSLEAARTAWWMKFAPLWERFDALLCPTTSVTAPLVGTTEADFGYTDDKGKFVSYEMTFPFNLFSACPALSFPSGFSANGLPTAVQIVGKPYQDLTVLQIGAALEQATKWLSRRPTGI